MAATMMPLARLTPTLIARFGTRWICSSGLVIVAVALTVVSQLSATSPYWRPSLSPRLRVVRLRHPRSPRS